MRNINRYKRKKILDDIRRTTIFERNYKKALKQIDVFLQTNADDIDALLLKGHILDLIEKYGESLKCYKKVLNIDKANVPAIIDIADVENKRGNVKKALNLYNQAISLLKRNIYYVSKEEELEEAYWNKIVLLRDQGQIKAAKRTVLNAERDCPSFKRHSFLKSLDGRKKHSKQKSKRKIPMKKR
jgi:tetratricopeptide (TPR) repeat protein